ncbi:MAG: hypothetical protein Q8O99_07325 [bacterium]|nr:hypothetical protein [bacterium]
MQLILKYWIASIRTKLTLSVPLHFPVRIDPVSPQARTVKVGVLNRAPDGISSQIIVSALSR